jgi:hypothetical protein
MWSGFDAVIIPAIRGVDKLHEAAWIAADSGCRLLIICSGGQINGKRVRAAMKPLSGIARITAFDLPQHYSSALFKFSTDAHSEAVEGRNNDVGLKRNIGIVLARMLGWESVVFLDDDVRQGGHDLLRETWSLLGSDPALDAVGWACTGAADALDRCSCDNSMVCHAARLAGFEQDTFVGGGALGIRVTDSTPFFPSVYNEDWLFLFDLIDRNAVALAGELTQLPYDPYQPPQIGWKQEFGDVLAEGLYRLFHEERNTEPARIERAMQVSHWSRVVELRLSLIDDIRVELLARMKQNRSLAGARARIGGDWPEALVDYVRSWRQDLVDWNRTLQRLPRAADLDQALAWLGLAGQDRDVAGDEVAIQLATHGVM